MLNSDVYTNQYLSYIPILIIIIVNSILIVKFFLNHKSHKIKMKKIEDLTTLLKRLDDLKHYSEIKKDVYEFESNMIKKWIPHRGKIDLIDVDGLKNEIVLKWGKWMPEELQEERIPMSSLHAIVFC